jgi:O-antigen ligase
MDFFCLLLLLVTVLLRPMELVPAMEGWPLYQITIVACLVFSAPKLLNQLSLRSLRVRPITVCVLGLFVAVVLSHLAHLRTSEAATTAEEFSKCALLYLLVVAVVTDRSRLHYVLLCLLGCILVLVILSLLHFHGIIDLHNMHMEFVEGRILQQTEVDQETGEIHLIARLQSTGIFNDPNDFALLLVFGICLGLYFLTSDRARIRRLLWLVPVGLFAYALALTQSRGGFMALVAALLLLFRERFGWKKALLLAGGTVPVLVLLFAGRQTNINVEDRQDTAQARIHLWSEGFEHFRQSPVFGMGADTYADEIGLVAHNSYVHSYVELGFLGGTFFVGAIYVSLLLLRRASARRVMVCDPQLRRLRPYLVAAVVGYAVGILSLSRVYFPPTYIVLALASVYAHRATTQPRLPPLPINVRFAGRLLAVSTLCLAGFYLFVRAFAQFS